MKKVLAFALVLVLVVALAAPACAISDKDEQNVITDDQIAAAYAKGWTPMYFDSYWTPFEATAISATLRDKGQMMNGARYNLSGQRVNDSYKGIVITNGKKFIMK